MTDIVGSATRRQGRHGGAEAKRIRRVRTLRWWQLRMCEQGNDLADKRGSFDFGVHKDINAT